MNELNSKTKTFITNNLEIGANAIPLDYLKYWQLILDNKTECNSALVLKSDQFKIFSFVLSTQLESSGFNLSEFPQSWLLDLFNTFQILIETSLINRTIDYKLFDIANYDKILDEVHDIDLFS